jgi:diaminohydroxyphosphoribosylaminopyrimidine deaminase/5-amino-6-(5-phosphoribosylamino)uracil reductase
MVGAGTVRADDPRLTCRLAGRPSPVRVVVAGRRVLPARARVLHDEAAPTWVFAARGGGAARRSSRAGPVVHMVEGRGGRPALTAVLRTLGQLGISRVLLEGGGELAASALRARIVDEVALFLAPILLGGDGAPAVGPLATRVLARAVRLADLRVERVGRDLLVRGIVQYPR